MIVIVKVSNEERNDHSSDNKFNDDNHHTFDIPIKQYIGEDLFNVLEDNPLKTNAIHSSLWEIKTLENHYLPAISSLARLLLKEKAQKEVLPIDEYLNTTYSSMMEKESQYRINQKTVLAYEKPDGLFPLDSLMNTCFTV